VAEQEAHPCDVVAGVGKARDDAKLDGVAAHRKNDGDCPWDHWLGSHDRAGAAGRHKHVHVAANQIARQRRYAINLPFSKARFDGDVLPLDEAHLFQPLTKCSHDARRISRAPLAEGPDHWHRRLLRLGRRRENANSYRAEEVSSFHYSMIWSARRSSD